MTTSRKHRIEAIDLWLSVHASGMVIYADRGWEEDLEVQDKLDIARFCDEYPGGWQAAIDKAFEAYPNQDTARAMMETAYAEGKGLMA